MKKIPNMLSTKDLSYFSDIFNWNAILINKIAMYINYIDDEELAEMMQNIRNTHIKSINMIKEALEGASA